jgi:EAL domain-containing protein (putative c-di-GMP-specific phosphodiesterase class I)
MTTTVEGLETVDQQQFLAALGCDDAQRFLLSPPVPIEEVPNLIAEWTGRKTLA